MIADAAPQPLNQFVIKPTVHCYHKCGYCHLRQDYYKDLIAYRGKSPSSGSDAWDAKANSGILPLDMAIRAVDEAATLGMSSLQLSGGDPLLYPHLLDLIRAGARHPGVFVFMNSVGTGITVDRAREIIAAGLGAWNFSVDTLNPVRYEKLRGVPGSLSTILRAIETVRQAAADWPEFCINYMTVITRDNFRDLPHLLRHCVDTGVASMYLMNVYGDTTGVSLLSESQIREFRDSIVPNMLGILAEKRLPDTVRSNAETVLSSFFGADNSDYNYAHGLYWPTNEAATEACRAPHYSALIEPDGRVLPCCLVEISHVGEVGSIDGQSLSQVWNGEAYATFRRERIAFCQHCPVPRNKTLGLVPKMCRQFNG